MEKCTAKSCSFKASDTTFASDNHLRFRRNLLERKFKKITMIDDKIRDEKLQYDIIREAANISALSSGKIDKYEFLTGGEKLLSHESGMIKQAKFSYSPQEKKLIDPIMNHNEN